MMRSLFKLSAAFAFGVLAQDCKPASKKPPAGTLDDPSLATSASAVVATPPPVPMAATVGDTADAGEESLEGKTPYQQAKILEHRGQLWMARLVLEKQALSPAGTKEEAELLASICSQQGDEECLVACGLKLGKKIKLDGGARRITFDAGREHKEPDNDAAHARDAILKQNWDLARKMLEAKVLEGRASKEEVRLLRQACQHQGDRMCVALCDAKLK